MNGPTPLPEIREAGERHPQRGHEATTNLTTAAFTAWDAIPRVLGAGSRHGRPDRTDVPLDQWLSPRACLSHRLSSHPQPLQRDFPTQGSRGPRCHGRQAGAAATPSVPFAATVSRQRHRGDLALDCEKHDPAKTRRDPTPAYVLAGSSVCVRSSQAYAKRAAKLLSPFSADSRRAAPRAAATSQEEGHE